MINVFGIWLLASHIAYLEPSRDGKECTAYFSGVGFAWYDERKRTFKASCDDVAKEINTKSKGDKS